jgi:hypothetical protein
MGSLEPRFRQNLVITITWRILAEIFRRQGTCYPLRILRLNPGGGTYETLALFAARQQDPFGESLFHMNWPSHHIHFFGSVADKQPEKEKDSSGCESGTNYVLEYLTSEDPSTLIGRIEQMCGFPPPPARLPPSSATVLALRTLASLVERFTFDPRPLTFDCGWIDTAWGAEPADWLSALPLSFDPRQPDDWREQMRLSSRFWKISVRDGTRSVVFDLASGLTYRQGGILNLVEQYSAAKRQLSPLVEGLYQELTLPREG